MASQALKSKKIALILAAASHLPSEMARHTKKQKEAGRKRGKSLVKKANTLGRIAKTPCMAFYLDPTHQAWMYGCYFPEGKPVPEPIAQVESFLRESAYNLGSVKTVLLNKPTLVPLGEDNDDEDAGSIVVSTEEEGPPSESTQTADLAEEITYPDHSDSGSSANPPQEGSPFCVTPTPSATEKRNIASEDENSFQLVDSLEVLKLAEATYERPQPAQQPTNHWLRSPGVQIAVAALVSLANNR